MTSCKLTSRSDLGTSYLVIREICDLTSLVRLGRNNPAHSSVVEIMHICQDEVTAFMAGIPFLGAAWLWIRTLPAKIRSPSRREQRKA